MLMILQWIKINKIQEISDIERKKILAVFTALSWFCANHGAYVKGLWDSLVSKDTFSKTVLQKLYFHNNKVIMCPLVEPSILREFLLKKVVEDKKVIRNNLYPKDADSISEDYKKSVKRAYKGDEDGKDMINTMWDHFISRLIENRSLLLFVQREYLNKEFSEFNQLENLEDTNAPWDWDHIYPDSWIYKKQYVNENMQKWNWTIGNLRAISLEANRSQGNRESPAERLAATDDEAKEKGLTIEKLQEQIWKESFIEDNDWEFWSKIDDRIYEDNTKKVNNHLRAVLHRLCNIYEEWYTVLDIGSVF
jgi:hypothetical protein